MAKKHVEAGVGQWQKLKGREEADIAEAMRLSLAEDLPRKQAMIMLNGHLGREGLRLVKVLADGNCQFHVVLSQLPDMGVDHLEFRQMVINHLAEREQFFAMYPEKFRGYKHCLTYIATPGEGWGDELTLMALATILMRPIVVINGRPVLSFKQTMHPVNAAKSFWPEKIVLAHHYPVHFDATEVAEVSADAGLVRHAWSLARNHVRRTVRTNGAGTLRVAVFF